MPPGRGVDAHCHVDLFPSPAELVARAESGGIYTIAVTNAPAVFAHTQGLVRGSEFVRAALGLHPELVSSRAHELDRLLALLCETRYVGEIGLDYTTGDREDRARQRRVFQTILERCAIAGNKVLSIHSRRASADVLSALGSAYPCPVILHWFSGSRADLDRAVAAGHWFSVNPAMLCSASGRRLVEAMPRDRVLTESDGPFIKFDSRPAGPEDAAGLGPALADHWHCSNEEAQATVLGNFHRAVGTF